MRHVPAGRTPPTCHANHPERGTAPHSHFFGEELPHRFFGPILPHPHQHTAFQIVDHGGIDLAFAPAHLIDSNHMHGRSHTVFSSHIARPASPSSLRSSNSDQALLYS